MKEKFERGDLKRVIHLTSVHGAHDTRILYRECVSLINSKYEPILIAPGESGLIANIVHIGLGRRRRLLLRIFLIHPKILWSAYLARAPIYHFHDPELIPIGLLLKATGAKVVYDVHEFYSEIIPLRVPWFLRDVVRRLCHAFLEKFPSRWFDYLVFPTEALRQEYSNVQKSSTLFNFPLLKASASARESSVAKDFDLIFVGTVSPFRAKIMVAVAEELVRRGVQLRFLFVGIAPSTVEWIKETFPAGFVASHLHFVARVPYGEVLDYMRRSRIGYNYHPMEKRFEVAIPMKVFEYMLAGIPVVTSKFPELERLLDADREVVFCGEDVASQADAIQGLLDNSVKARQIADAGRLAVLDRLNWDASESGKLIRVYDSLVN